MVGVCATPLPGMCGARRCPPPLCLLLLGVVVAARRSLLVAAGVLLRGGAVADAAAAGAAGDKRGEGRLAVPVVLLLLLRVLLLLLRREGVAACALPIGRVPHPSLHANFSAPCGGRHRGGSHAVRGPSLPSQLVAGGSPLAAGWLEGAAPAVVWGGGGMQCLPLLLLLFLPM